MAKPNFILPNKPAIKAGSILSYNYTDDLKFAAEPLDFSRNSSATRVNEQGLIEEVGYFGPQLVQNGDFSQEGSELITNGDFATDTDWGMQVSWSIANGSANFDGLESHYIQQSNVFAANTNYKLTFTISNNTSGIISIRDGAAAVLVPSTNYTNGTYTFYITSTANTSLKIFGVGGSGSLSIDNVSVKEVGQNWTLGTGWGIGDNLISLDTSNAYVNFNQSIGTVINKTYKITYTLSNYSSGAVQYIIGNAGVRPQGQLRSVDGTYSETFTIDSSTVDADKFFIRGGASGFTGSISNISAVEVLGDKPRIDYSDSSTEPSLLLEPQSTNLMPYSQTITEFNQNNATRFDNQTISPDGTQNAGGATKLGGANDRIKETITVSNSTTYNISAFVKNSTIAVGGVTAIGFRVSGGTLFRKGYEWGASGLSFSSAQASGTRTNEILKDYGNGWYRIGFSFTTDGTSGSFEIDLDRQNGSDTTTLFIWGAQVEQLSYATSYIPTSGSTATRLGETANNAGGAGVFNSEEGVLYVEIAALANDLSQRVISLSDGSYDNSVRVQYYLTANVIEFRIVTGGVIQAIQRPVITNVLQFNKIAVSYAENNFALWVNGVKVATDTNGNTPIGLSELSFDDGNGNADFYGKTKNIQVFNYVLTDEELQTLTT